MVAIVEILLTPENIDHCKVVEELSPSITEINYLRRTLRGAWVIPLRFCHTKGTIAHGGTISFILDTSMFLLLSALSNNEKGGLSLGLNIQFFNACKPGKVDVYSKMIKEGKNIVFGSCDLYQGDDIVASGTQQMKVFRNSKELNFNTFFSENVTHIR